MLQFLERSIGGRFLYMIDNQDFDRSSRRFQAKSELLLNRSEDGGPGGSIRGVRSPTQVDVVSSRESGLVDDGAAHLLGKEADEQGHRNRVADQIARARYAHIGGRQSGTVARALGMVADKGRLIGG